MDNKFEMLLNNVIYSETIGEASDALYGKNGLHIDFYSYYEKMIASFGIKVQQIIFKNGNTLILNLEKNVKELWNIIFIGNYIYEKINKSNQRKLNNSNVSQEEINRILANNENLRRRIAETNIIIPESINLTENLIDEIKKSVTLIQKVKDSTMHMSDTNSYEFDLENKMLIISNVGGRFDLPKIEIPLDYIEGFINSYILPRIDNEDEARKVDELVFPLLQSLNFDPKNLTNFFYRIEPYKLNFILELTNHDMSKLYKVNPFVFSCDLKYLKQLLIKSDGDFNILCDLPNNAYIYIENTLSFIEKYGLKNLDKLTNTCFKEFNLINELIKKYGIEIINEITNWKMFNYEDSSIHSLYHYYDNDVIEGFKELSRKYEKDVIKQLPYYALTNYLVTEELLKEYNLDMLISLPEVVYENLRHIQIRTMSIIGINQTKDLPDYTNTKKLLKKYSVNELKKIPEYAFKYPGALINILNNVGIEEIKKVPMECYLNPHGTMPVLNYLKNHKINKINIVDKVYIKKVDESKIPEIIRTIKEDKEMEQDTKEKLINDLINKKQLELHRKIRYEPFSENVLNRILLIVKYPKAFDYFLQKEKDPDKTIKIINELPEWAIKHYKKGYYLFKQYGIKTIKKIPDISVEQTRKWRFSEFGDKITGDIKFPKGTKGFLKKYKNRLDDFPIEFFYYPIGADYLLSYFDINSLKQLPAYAFRESKKTKKIIEEFGIELASVLPEFVYSEKNNIDCIRNVIEIVNGNINKIKELPKEFFVCHNKEVLSELYYNYNKVITQSIFKNKNPKIIALIVYAKNILPKWDYNSINANKDLRIQLSNINFKGLNLLEIQNIIENDTINTKLDGNTIFPINNKYCNMLNGIISNNVEHAITSKRKEFEFNIREKIGIYLNNNLIRPLRNAESHFRFEDVYNNDGIIDINKVRIFDMNEDGIITYDRIFEIDTVYNFLKQINLFINGQIEEKSFNKLFDEINDGSMPLTSAIENYIPKEISLEAHRAR